MARDFLSSLPPQHLESEQAVLGCLMIDAGTVATVREIVDVEDFFRGEHRAIFRAAMEIDRRGEPADPLTVQIELERAGMLDQCGGVPYLLQLVNAVPTTAHAAHYAQTVADKARMRRIIRLGNEMICWAQDGEQTADEIVAKVETGVYRLAKRGKGAGLQPMRDLFFSVLERAEQAMETPDTLSGSATGFDVLDRMTAGIRQGNLAVMAGRTSMGKTSCGLQVVRHVAERDQKPVAIFSLEMSREEIATRMMCAEARVDSVRLDTGRLRDRGYGGRSDTENLAAALGFLGDLPLHIDDEGETTVAQLRSKARRLASTSGLAMVLIDYLQLIAADQHYETRQQHVSATARALKAMARELGVPVLALAQLNRKAEDRGEKRPQLSDLAESGTIENASDLVMLLYRPAYYERKMDAEERMATDEMEEAELIVAKHRNGPTGTVKLGFHSRYARFENLEERF